MSGLYSRLFHFPYPKVNNTNSPQWITRLMMVILFCYPFIGARFLPFGDSGRFLSVLVAPFGLFYLAYVARQTSFPLLLDGIKKLSIWLPFFTALGIVSWLHESNFNWAQLSQRFLFAVILYACARHLLITHKQLITAAVVGAWLYLFCAFFDAWTFYYPETFQLQIPRHLTEMGIYRVGGGGGNPIHFADACIWLAGICGLGIFQNEQLSSKEKNFILSGALIVFLVSLTTHSRGALLALIPLFILFVYKTEARYKKFIFAAFIVVLIIAFWLATQTEFFHRIKRVFFDLYYYLTEPNFIISSVSARIEMWHIAITSWQQNFFFGTGVSNIQDLVKVYPPANTLHPAILAQPHFHNDWMQSISLGGVLLLFGLLSTYILLIINSRKNIILLWIVLAGFCFGLSDLIFYQNTMLTFFISTWALFSAGYDNQQFSQNHTHHS